MLLLISTINKNKNSDQRCQHTFSLVFIFVCLVVGRLGVYLCTYNVFYINCGYVIGVFGNVSDIGIGTPTFISRNCVICSLQMRADSPSILYKETANRKSIRIYEDRQPAWVNDTYFFKPRSGCPLGSLTSTYTSIYWQIWHHL